MLNPDLLDKNTKLKTHLEKCRDLLRWWIAHEYGDITAEVSSSYIVQVTEDLLKETELND